MGGTIRESLSQAINDLVEAAVSEESRRNAEWGDASDRKREHHETDVARERVTTMLQRLTVNPSCRTICCSCGDDMTCIDLWFFRLCFCRTTEKSFIRCLREEMR